LADNSNRCSASHIAGCHELRVWIDEKLDLRLIEPSQPQRSRPLAWVLQCRRPALQGDR
jgi:hypothetical protein